MRSDAGALLSKTHVTIVLYIIVVTSGKSVCADARISDTQCNSKNKNIISRSMSRMGIGTARDPTHGRKRLQKRTKIKREHTNRS